MLWTDGDYLVSDRDAYPGTGVEGQLGYKPPRSFESLAQDLGFQARTWKPLEKKFFRFRSRRQFEWAILLGVALTDTAHVEQILGMPTGSATLTLKALLDG